MPPSALEDLEQRKAAVEEAKVREREAEAALRSRTRELTSLREQRLDYEREVGGGRARDPELEQRLDAGLNAPDVAEMQRTPYGRSPYVELVDRRAEARLDGAREAREGAEQELRAFCAGHLDALEAELAQGSPEDRKALYAAWDGFSQAERAWFARRQRMAEVFRLSGHPDRVGELPPDPIALPNQVLQDFAAARIRRPDAHLPVPVRET